MPHPGWKRWLTDLQAADTRIELIGARHLRLRRPFIPRFVAKPNHTLFLVDQNHFVIRTHDSEHRLEAGQMAWISPGVEFAMEDNQPQHPARFHGAGFAVTRKGRMIPAPAPFLYVECPRLASIFNLLDEQQLEPVRYGMETLRPLLVTLSWLVRGEMEKPDRGKATTLGLTAPERSRLERFVRERLPHRTEPRQLAAELQWAPDYFSRLFKRSYGVAPKTWLLHQRLQAAAEWLLESNDTISEVADRFEFSDVYNFSQQFKLHHGSSPRHYREKQRLLLLD